MRVLVVEKDRTVRQQLNRMVSRFSRCDEVASERDALAAIQRALRSHDPFAVVLVNGDVPEQTGNRLLNRIREYEQASQLEPESAKIVFGAAHGENSSRNSYLEMPVTEEKLIAQLRKLALVGA